MIWGQSTGVEKFVMRECHSLDDLLRFSHYVNADSSRAIRCSVADYSQGVIQSEWQRWANAKRSGHAYDCGDLECACHLRKKRRFTSA